MNVVLDETIPLGVDLKNFVKYQEGLIESQKAEIAFLRDQIITLQNNASSESGEPVTFEELFDQKINNILSSDGKNENGYRRAFQLFNEWLDGSLTYINQLTEKDVDLFYVWLRSQKTSTGKTIQKSSANLYYSFLKTTFELGRKRKYLKDNVWPVKPIPKPRLDTWWTREYLNDLIKAIRKFAPVSKRRYYETVIRLLFTTGIRIGKLLDTKQSEMRIEGNRVWITTKLKIKGTAEYDSHESEILDPIAKKMLLQQCKRHNKYCLKPDDRAIYSLYNSLIRSFKGRPDRNEKGICEKAGFHWLGFHKAKHGYITERVVEGFSYEQIGKLTGNKSIELMRRIYDHCVPQDYIEEVRRNMEEKAIII